MNSRFLSVVFGLFVLVSALGQERSAWALIEAQVNEAGFRQVEAFFNDHHNPVKNTMHTQRSEDNSSVEMPIRFWSALQTDRSRSDSAIVIVPGRGESFIKYPELAKEFFDAGYSVYVIDHRGQGFSGRESGLEDHSAVYVKNFDTYVSDFEAFVDNVVLPNHHQRLYLFAHSMGGAIAALYLQKHPAPFGPFRAAVLSSPMLGIFEDVTVPFTKHQVDLRNGLSKDFADFLDFIGDAKKFAPGEGPFNPSPVFLNNLTTGSENRFTNEFRRANTFPEDTHNGGSTNMWVDTVIKATTREIPNIKSLGIPIVLLQAGGDRIVRPEPQKQFCDSQGELCQLVILDKGHHELYMEVDRIRSLAVSMYMTFFASH